MTDCKGLFGKLFGHEYDQYLITSGVSLALFMELPIEIQEKYLDHLISRWELRCKRCGAKPDE